MAERKFTVTLEMHLSECLHHSAQSLANEMARRVALGSEHAIRDCRPIEASWADGRDPGFLRVDFAGQVA